jgi:hypothetical protein
MCGQPFTGPPVCWSRTDPIDECIGPSARDGQVVDFWPDCAMNERGALLCEKPGRTVDLDQP